jgi:ADP-ribose pyrophosphatase YjhB (NUDIX family)
VELGRVKIHCTYCGRAFDDSQTGWPRTCGGCRKITYKNPLPVVVVLLPVQSVGAGSGLLVIRRSVKDDPGYGALALPGGFIDINDETWQHAAARELREETGIVLPPDAFKEFSVHSAPNGTLLIFALARGIGADVAAGFKQSNETSEMRVIHEPCELAFDLHTECARTWFDRLPR